MLSRRRSSGTVSAMSWPFPAADPLFRGGAGGTEVGVGEHGQGDVPVPGGVVTHLVGVQPGLVLGRLETLLDPPPAPGHRDELFEGGLGLCQGSWTGPRVDHAAAVAAARESVSASNGGR